MTGLDQVTLVSAATFIPLSVGAFVFLIRQRRKILSADQKPEDSRVRSRTILSQIAEKLKEERQKDKPKASPFSTTLFDDTPDLFEANLSGAELSATVQTDPSIRSHLEELVTNHIARLMAKEFLSLEDAALLELLGRQLESLQVEENPTTSARPKRNIES